MGNLCVKFGALIGAASESAAAPVSHNVADPVEVNYIYRTKLKLPDQTDSEAVLFSGLSFLRDQSCYVHSCFLFLSFSLVLKKRPPS